jgi:hypothetical protein
MTCFDDPGVKDLLDERAPGPVGRTGVVDPHRRETLRERIQREWLRLPGGPTRDCPVCDATVAATRLAVHIGKQHDAGEVFGDD